MTDLKQILDNSRPALEAGLVAAERELAELDARRLELEELISRARAALGAVPAEFADSPMSERLTLHEAMQLILREHGNRWMSVRELADAINERALYEKRDRSPVEPGQIHARANKYGSMFEKDGRRIRLESAGT